jgi:glutathione S-transferase
MQLYSAPHSPYAARCRMQILHKQLPVAIVPPPGGMGSAALKAKNPSGKIPVLDLGDDALAESWAILDYLEARFPQPPMRPDDALAAARLQELVRFTDLYLAPAMFPLFVALRGAAEPATIDASLKALQTQLQALESLIRRKTDLLPLDLGDAALLPVIWYARILTGHFGAADCLAPLPATRTWWQRVSTVPAAAAVLAEMEAGLRAAMPALFAAPAEAPASTPTPVPTGYHS